MGANVQFAVPPQSWETLCEAFQMAQDDVEQCDAGDDQELAFYVKAMCEARRALLLAPAPDGAALARKLAIYADEECWGFGDEWQLDIFPALVADAQALGGRR